MIIKLNLFIGITGNLLNFPFNKEYKLYAKYVQCVLFRLVLPISFFILNIIFCITYVFPKSTRCVMLLLLVNSLRCQNGYRFNLFI